MEKQNVIPRAACDAARGLTAAQVREREAAGLTNAVTDKTSRTYGEIICSNTFTYFNLIFFVLAGVLIYEHSYNNILFLGVVFSNMLIGIVQEVRSKQMLDKLKLVAEPEVTVVREGKAHRLHSAALVRDDIVQFCTGVQICADAEVLAGELTVNEALVTGESDEIRKTAGDTLLSGSFVVSGSAAAQLTRVGGEAYAARLSKEAKHAKNKAHAGMMWSLTVLIRTIGLILIPFGIWMFCNQRFVLGLEERVSVENTAASIIGMIPEGLYLLTSIALAASTIRLAKRQTLVHDMKCIETLARVDVICVDKTGTITEPEMRVREVTALNDADSAQLLCDYVLAHDTENETMAALRRFIIEKAGAADEQPVRVMRFSSAHKYSAAQFAGHGTLVLGAPEMLLAAEDPLRSGTIASYAAEGVRVLLFAACKYPNAPFSGDLKAGDVIPIALVLLENGIRPNAKETFAYFAEQGVAVKVISGDNPLTAAAAARKAGVPNAERSLDVSQIQSEEALIAAASEYTVFGRVTPEQKRVLIRALKAQGHTVAMTGDGVNDILALRDADCSIAMASGSEAAANVSDLVLLDSDFSGMPQIVAEGRRVINNIERSASLFLVKNIFSFLLTVLTLIAVVQYPLKPSQVSLAAALMIGLPSFVLALEPSHERVRGRFLRNVLVRAFPAGLTAAAVVAASMWLSGIMHIPAEEASTLACYLYAFTSYLMLFRVCKPMHSRHLAMYVTLGAAFVGAVLMIPSFFQITPISGDTVLLFSALALAALPLYALLRLCFRRMEKA